MEVELTQDTSNSYQLTVDDFVFSVMRFDGEELDTDDCDKLDAIVRKLREQNQ